MRDFIADAFAHSKFLAYNATAQELIAKIIAPSEINAGFIQIKKSRDYSKFMRVCRKLRY